LTSKLELKSVAAIALLILLAVVSITKIAPWAADPANHTHTIEQTDEKISAVMTLSGGAAATSATISLLPGDLGTPIAEQLAELATYFLMILSALYLEKFLIIISARITFMVIIPVACLLQSLAILLKKKALTVVAGKLAFMGLIIVLIVPASVVLSDMVYQTQAETVNSTIEEYNELEIEGDAESGILGEFTSITNDTIARISAFLGDMLETLAVMIVTSCVIPILVFVFLAWLTKVIFLPADRN
jgi:hypothetical protein